MRHILAAVALVCTIVLLNAGVSIAGGQEVAATVVTKSEAPQCTKPKCIICANAMSDSYLNKAGGRFVRGFSNATLGGTCELGRSAVETAQQKAGGWKIFDNLGWGCLDAFTRTCGGITDVFTFWEPQIHNDKMNPNCAFGRSEIVDR